MQTCWMDREYLLNTGKKRSSQNWELASATGSPGKPSQAYLPVARGEPRNSCCGLPARGEGQSMSMKYNGGKRNFIKINEPLQRNVQFSLLTP